MINFINCKVSLYLQFIHNVYIETKLMSLDLLGYNAQESLCIPSGVIVYYLR